MDKIEEYTQQLNQMNTQLAGLEGLIADTKKKIEDLHIFQGYHNDIVSNIEAIITSKQNKFSDFLNLANVPISSEQINDDISSLLFSNESQNAISNKYTEQSIIKEVIQQLEASQALLQNQKSQINQDITNCTNNLKAERAKNEQSSN